MRTHSDAGVKLQRSGSHAHTKSCSPTSGIFHELAAVDDAALEKEFTKMQPVQLEASIWFPSIPTLRSPEFPNQRW